MFLLFNSIVLFGQIIKIRGTNLSLRTKENNTWDQWSVWKKVDILIALNLKDERLTINSKETQKYDIVKIDIDDKTRSINMNCFDSKGIRCEIFIDAVNKQIFILYNNTEIKYSYYMID